MFRISCRIAAALLLVGAFACTDVTTEPTSTVTGSNIFDDPDAYRSFLAKLYGGLSLTGQQGPAGAADIEGIDEGFSHYLRQLWQLQELPTDEAVIGWGDPGLPELNTMNWAESNVFLAAMYYRVFYQVALTNEFLRETSDAKLTERNVSPTLRAEIQQYRAEARFLRALSYWHGIDLFGDIPLVKETDLLGAEPPEQQTRAEIFAYIEEELNAVLGELPAVGQGQYGRADRGAALMLLSKLYMNAEAYGLGARYGDALAAVQQVISSGGYALDDDYDHLFLADNHTSPEIIFAIPSDGQHMRTYGGMTFLTHAGVGGNMNAAEYGIDGGWWGLRVTQQLVQKFPGGAAATDERASIFYTNGQSLEVNSISDFFAGYAAPKFRNVTSSGQPGTNPAFPDTDYPMFRLADAYLTYAEAVVRGGGGSTSQATTYVNQLRERAYGDASGNIDEAQLTLDFLLDERARELYWEGHRRTDLIRFGKYTGGDYLWAWKGGAQEGQPVEACKAIYPLPSSELVANPNLTQTGGC